MKDEGSRDVKGRKSLPTRNVLLNVTLPGSRAALDGEAPLSSSTKIPHGTRHEAALMRNSLSTHTWPEPSM